MYCRPHDRVPLNEMKADWHACLDNRVGFKVRNFRPDFAHLSWEWLSMARGCWVDTSLLSNVFSNNQHNHLSLSL